MKVGLEAVQVCSAGLNVTSTSLMIYKMAGVAVQLLRGSLDRLHRPALDMTALGRRRGGMSVDGDVANVLRQRNEFN